jgi:hypothetical protein
MGTAPLYLGLQLVLVSYLPTFGKTLFGVCFLPHLDLPKSNGPDLLSHFSAKTGLHQS